MSDQTRRLDEDFDPNAETISIETIRADTYLHFGPGVPVPARPPAPDRATALWRGEVSAVPAVEDPLLTRRRKTQRWILPLTVLILVIAVLIYYFWQRHSPGPLGVNGVTVQAAEPSLGCGGTERLTAVVDTDGGAGSFQYQWLRSDGTSSARLTQQVASGERNVSVTLDWSFDGYGATTATATISILSPGVEKEAASFTYECAK